jgi:hypothetical protein
VAILAKVSKTIATATATTTTTTMETITMALENNPSVAGRMQGDHSHGTWNNNGQQQQPNSPNTCFNGSDQ